nr:hypothetical protein [Tanacetum cinerariifolium]
MASMGSSPFLNTRTVRLESSWGNSEVSIIDWLSIVETDKMIHIMEIDIVKLVVENKCFGMVFDEFGKETVSVDKLQLGKVDLSCVHALNEFYLHEIHVVSSKHEADQVEDKEVDVGEGVVVTSSSLEILTNSCLGGIMVSLIFLEGLEEEALMEFIVELFKEDEDGKKNEKDGLFNLKARDQSRKS